jgi:hypothetical protein
LPTEKEDGKSTHIKLKFIDYKILGLVVDTLYILFITQFFRSKGPQDQVIKESRCLSIVKHYLEFREIILKNNDKRKKKEREKQKG